MCRACFEEQTRDGIPEITAEMENVMAGIRAIYDSEWGSVGGPLHVEIEDMNLDDVFFDDKHAQAFKDLMKTHYAGMTQEDQALCSTVFDGLRALTPAQRAVCAYRAWGPRPDAARLQYGFPVL